MITAKYQKIWVTKLLYIGLKFAQYRLRTFIE